MTRQINLQDLTKSAEHIEEVGRFEAAAIALAARAGYAASSISEINISDAGEVTSVMVGRTEDGMARYVLGFAI